MPHPPIRTALTLASDPATAVAELQQQLGEGCTAVVAFCSSHYDLVELGRQLAAGFTCPVMACTSAGELIHSHGYVHHAMVAMGFMDGCLHLETVLIDKLAKNPYQQHANDLQRSLRQVAPADVGLLLSDGLSGCEEILIAAIQHCLPTTPIVGGSAGDDLRFKRTQVYHQGQFHSDIAVLGLCHTSLRVKPFQLQHFQPSERKLVITRADPERRRVYEIDGLPAAQAYAAAIGCLPAALSPQHFASHPLMLRLGGQWFVRSVQQRHSDDSLSFYCAIEEGLVLTMAQAGDLVNEFAHDMASLSADMGTIHGIISFDCILRRLDAQQRQVEAALAERMAIYPLMGLSTYGEQCHGIHVNHTMTGVIFGDTHG